MAIPDYQTLMLPLLRIASDGQEHRVRDAVEQLASEFKLTDAQRAELLPSGTAPVFDNRVGWARTYLKQAGLLISPKRGIFQITNAGRQLLAKKPTKINAALLEQYPAFVAFAAAHKIPAMYEFNFLVQDGGLMSYGASQDENLRRAAVYVDRLFKGATAGTLPVERPSRYYLAINQKTARTQGFTFPPSILVRADQVIE